MSQTRRRPKRHRANVSGDFYVEDESCIICMTPHYVAPELMGMHPENHCYFKKQPNTPEEVEQAIEAVSVACCESLRYAGDDPDILSRLKAKGCAAQCDVLIFGNKK